MRALREDERDEIECVKHLIKYVNTKPNIESHEIWNAVLQLNDIGKKYVISNIVSQKELNELCDLDDMKELIEKLMFRLISHIENNNKK